MSSSSGSRRSRARSSFRQWAAPGSTEDRRDFDRPVVESAGHEEATAHNRDRPRGAPARPLRRDLRHGGRLMLSLAVALPLAVLPVVSLLGALGWMATSSQSS